VLPHFLVSEVVKRALAEDLLGGDLTGEALIAEDARAQARIIAKSPLVVCGAQIVAQVFHQVEPGTRLEVHTRDGALASPGQLLWLAEGRAQALLMAERTALNFAQRLSGIATLAHAFVAQLPQGSSTRITDTRKTTPGLRALERYAVRVGGAHNHRDALGAAVLIKENHIAAAGGVGTAISRARKLAPHTSRIEVEVEVLSQVKEALAAGADIIMLDEFEEGALKLAVAEIGDRALIEVSGGITLEQVPALAALGVHIISVGALTHSAKAADLSLELEPFMPEP
jgi:nicotinate-nucleotide pyrophosphorylase (carboxylating)